MVPVPDVGQVRGQADRVVDVGHAVVDLSSTTTNPRGNSKPLQTTSFCRGTRISQAFAVIAALLLFEQTGDFTSPATT